MSNNALQRRDKICLIAISDKRPFLILILQYRSVEGGTNEQPENDILNKIYNIALWNYCQNQQIYLIFISVHNIW